MTYNVFGGTLNLAQSINPPPSLSSPIFLLLLLFLLLVILIITVIIGLILLSIYELRSVLFHFYRLA